ncbi:MAG: hypothetical protein U0324_46335 [Polyangiales bacterium]
MDTGFPDEMCCCPDARGVATLASARIQRGGEPRPLACVRVAPGEPWLSGCSFYLVPTEAAASTPSVSIQIRARFGGGEAETVVAETALSNLSLSGGLAPAGGSLYHLSGRRVSGFEVWAMSDGAEVPCMVRFATTRDGAAPWFAQAGGLV